MQKNNKHAEEKAHGCILFSHQNDASRLWNIKRKTKL
jgi:hypothetical protein